MLSRLPSLRFAATLALCAIASCAVACSGDGAPDRPVIGVVLTRGFR
jgi:hypothetical protein